MPEYAPDMTQPYHMSKPTEPGIARFTALLEELSAKRDVVKASMFGMPGIKRRGGKAFCGLYGEDMIFKLTGDDHARALSLQGAHLFEPMAGRPMKAWVQVPPEHQSQYALWHARLRRASATDDIVLTARRGLPTLFSESPPSEGLVLDDTLRGTTAHLARG